MFKGVTDSQGLDCARMARAKGVSREKFQQAQVDGTLSRVLDAIKCGRPVLTSAAEILAARVPKWIEEKGIIYFSVTSDGTDGKSWITRLKQGGHDVDHRAESVLLSPDFEPTSGVTTVGAILGSSLFRSGNWNMRYVLSEARARILTPEELFSPNAEVACLFREKFTDDEIGVMGFRQIFIMHGPVQDIHNHELRRLNARRDFHSLDASDCEQLYSDHGAAFAVSQTRN